MSSFFSLNFTGSFDSLQNFFDGQRWNFEIKQISNSKAILKTSNENTEELRFFVNTDNDTYNVKYHNVIYF
jgi:hypothetical protein